LALRAIPDLRWKVSVRGIGPMSISLRRNRSYWLRDPLTHESFMLSALERIVQPGDVVLDAGANIGLYSRFLIQRFGAGKVIAIEPMEQNWAYLNRNICLGNCRDQIVVLCLALADYDGEGLFETDDMSSASGTLSVITGGAPCQGRRQYGLTSLQEKVRVARLDSLVESGEIAAPQVMKIDVEGAEELLLRGAVRLLQCQSPTLAIEFHGANGARAAVTFLWSVEYRVFGFLQTRDNYHYTEITPSNIDAITGEYSLHFCVAGRDRQCLTAPLKWALKAS
jgi:FkbM family methyltransferase